MKHYIFKNHVVTFDKEVDREIYSVSDKIEDRARSLVAMTDKQVEYYTEHPQASVLEIWNMKADEAKSSVLDYRTKNEYVTGHLREFYSQEDELDIFRHLTDGKRKTEIEAYYKKLDEIEANAEKIYNGIK